MKTKLLIIQSLLFSFTLCAQITITKTDFADGGDTVRMSYATDPAIDYSSSGANFSWDFSGLIAESQEVKSFNAMTDVSVLVSFVYGIYAPVKYQATNFIPSTALPLDQMTFLPVTISEVNQFSKNANDSITSVGFSAIIDGNEVPFKSDTIETRYRLPLNYNDVYSSRGYTNLDMNPFYDAIWRQHRQRFSVVDGWGVITTPYGTFNALRVAHTIYETDSLYFTFSGFGNWIELPIPESHIYEWWANGEKEPVMRITTDIITGNESVRSIEYRDFNRMLDASVTENSSLEFTLYPNPVVDQLHLKAGNGPMVYEILNLDGKSVLKGESLKPETTVSLQHLTSGGYIVILNSNGQLGYSSFIKK